MNDNVNYERVDLTPVPELRVVGRQEASNMGQDQAEDCDQETCEPTQCACKQSAQTYCQYAAASAQPAAFAVNVGKSGYYSDQDWINAGCPQEAREHEQ